jgi:uncharacterized protein involved in outer membrane biogenesis
LFIALLVGIKVYVTKERIMAWVIPPLEERLQRDVTLADAGAGLTGIYLDGLSIRAQGAEQPLVAAGTIQVRWDLFRLLTGTLDVKEVRLLEPHLHVVRLPDGALDIDDLLAPTEAEGRPHAESSRPAPTTEGSIALAVALFSLEKGRVSFEDRTKTPWQTYTLDQIDSRVRDISLDRPFNYELSARLPLTETGRFRAEGTVDPVARAMRAKVSVQDLDMPSLNAVMTGGTRFTGGVLGVDLDVEAGGAGNVGLDGTVALNGLALTRGEVTGKAADVELAVEATADFGPGIVKVPKLELRVDDQAVHLELTASRIAARPRIEFLVEADDLSVDALTALLPAGKETGAAGKETAAEKAATVPVDALGDLRFAKVRAGGLTVEEFNAHVEVVDGRLTVEPAGARLYGGALTLSAKAGLEQAGPPFDARVSMSDVQVGQFLGALNPRLADTMTGVLVLAAASSGRGGDLAELRSRVQAEAKNGKILNHPLVQNFAQMFKVKEYETLNFYSVKADIETAEGTGQVKSLVLNGPNLQATGTGTIGLIDRSVDLRMALAVPEKIAAKVVPEQNTLEAITDKDGWARLPMSLKGSLQEPAYGLDKEALIKAATKALGGKAEKEIEEKVLKKVPLDQEQKDTLKKGIKSLFGN